MVPPITMCENGHSICPKCKPKLNNCPSCKKPFLQVRNLALESLSRQAITEEAQLPPDRFPHNVECPFAMISNDICPWKGSVTGIKDHVKLCHKNPIDTYEARGGFTVVLTGLSPTQHYRKAVFIADELFYIYWRIKDDSFYCTVFYVGEQEKCSNYTYRFVLTTDSDNRKISMSFPTRSIMENLEELLNSGDCVILNYNTVLKFINPDMNLECEFQINAIELAEVISDGVSQPHSCAETHVHSSTVLINTPGSNVASGTNPLQNNQQQTVLNCAPSVNLTEGASANYNSLQSAPAKTDLYSDPKGNISPALSKGVKSVDENLSYSDRSLLTEKISYNWHAGYVLSKSSSESFWKCPICEQIAPIFPVSLPQPEWQVSSSVPDSKRCKMCGLKLFDEKFSPSLSNDVKSCDEKLSCSDRNLLTEKPSYSVPTGYVASKSSSNSFRKCPICDQIVPSVPVSLPQPGCRVSSSVPDSKRCKMCGQIKQYPSVGRSEQP